MAPVKRFEDLIAWQLSVRLRDAIFRHTSSGSVAQDRRFCDQIRESSRSAARNLSEGFDRSKPRESARFARIARGALCDTKNHILDGVARDYFKTDVGDAMLSLQRRAQEATTRLIAYLDSCKNGTPNDRAPT